MSEEKIKYMKDKMGEQLKQVKKIAKDLEAYRFLGKINDDIKMVFDMMDKDAPNLLEMGKKMQDTFRHDKQSEDYSFVRSLSMGFEECSAPYLGASKGFLQDLEQWLKKNEN